MYVPYKKICVHQEFVSTRLGLLVGLLVPLSGASPCVGSFIASSSNSSSVVWLMSSSVIWLSTSDGSLGS